MCRFGATIAADCWGLHSLAFRLNGRRCRRLKADDDRVTPDIPDNNDGRQDNRSDEDGTIDG
ncbi:MAG: hypothetical protein UZ13_00270 [Chloroflexi bacterium OLB13]|nr:MAG: hypothetical protein UZ13_00270 [Chloroflexi bacterium OLB13]